jgi:predicted nuclease of predicted toxin-antitoxin system
MKVRFQADADLKIAIALAVRRLEPMIDFQTANETGLPSMKDREVLALCAKSGRMLVSHDRKTMPHHFAEFITNEDSPGLVIILQSVPVSKAAEELLLIWAASESEEWVNQISIIK